MCSTAPQEYHPHHLIIRSNFSCIQDPPATALNDNAKGTDRFDYDRYAQALVKMLDNADPPVCVGLYANWGSGKSFLMHRLKMRFDPTSTEDSRTYQMVQWFEDSYDALKKTEHLQDMDAYLKDQGRFFWVYIGLIFMLSMPFLLLCVVIWCACYCIGGFCFGYFGTIETILQPSFERCWTRVVFLYSCFSGSYSGCKETFASPSNLWEALFSYLPYSVQTVISIFVSTLTPEWLAAFWRGDRKYMFKTDHNDEESPKWKKENIFTDFNAWEFSQTDELWVGIVSKTYERIELRLENHQQLDESTGKMRRIDYKAKWRVQKAVKLLMKQYGGARQVGLRILCAFILLSSVPVVAWVITAYHKFVGAWFVLIGFLAPLVPVVRFFISSNGYAGVSRGQVLFEQAERNQVWITPSLSLVIYVV